jgi:hypothetical protein
MMNYCNDVGGFINYALSNLENISEGNIRCSCKSCKNKKVSQSRCCYNANREPYVPYETMVEKIVESTSNSSNMHEVVDDNSNCYRSMVMNALRMNQGYTCECSVVHKELNADTTMIFKLLKDSHEPLWDGCTNHSKLLVVTQMFTIKSDHGLSVAGYEKIIK